MSGGTLISRVLGLFRDVLFFATFGTSFFGEAFLLAFTIPNLFRRMLGEGTLSSAFIPIFSNIRGADLIQWNLLNQVVTRLMGLLGLLSFSVACFALISYQSVIFENLKWHVASYLNGVTFFYVIFICTSAILVAALQVKGSFHAGAVSPIILNLFMIATLVTTGVIYELDFRTSAVLLSISVVVAGAFQLVLPWIELKKKFGWRWRFNLSKSEELVEVGSLFWVGVLGAAVAQVNILISRFLAYSLEQEGAVTYLYMSARLVELPLGIFAIAISTILFPKLATANNRKDQESYLNHFFFGLRFILMLTLPSAIGLFLVGDLIVKVLFQWQEFTEQNAYMAYDVLKIVAWTIPLYAVSTFLVKSYHSQKNMKAPLTAAILSLFANLLLSLLLMFHFGVFGLAWANFFAALIQLFYLCAKSDAIRFHLVLSKHLAPILMIFLATFLMFATIYLGRQFVQPVTQKWESFLHLFFWILIGAGSYFLTLYFLKFPMSDEKPLLYRFVRK